MDYQKGKIYKIESHLGDKVYVGSTTKEYLSQRMASHRKSYNQWKQGKTFTKKTTSFELFDEYGSENCIITLIELCPCKCKDELSAYEAYYIRTLKSVNKCIPLRSKQEYNEENKDKIKKYNDDHKEEHKLYREVNKEKLKEDKKKYYIENKDRLNEYKKQWYQEKKAKEKAKLDLSREQRERIEANKKEMNRIKYEKAKAKKLEQSSS